MGRVGRVGANVGRCQDGDRGNVAARGCSAGLPTTPGSHSGAPGTARGATRTPIAAWIGPPRSGTFSAGPPDRRLDPRYIGRVG